MVLFGLLIFGAGFLLFGQIRNLWMFYLAYLVMALGQGLGSWIPLMTMLNHWFVRRRATAMGWANVGSRGGALLLVPAIAWAIDPDHDRLGWKLTATALGLFALLVAFPISRLIRNRPQEYGLLPDGGAGRLSLGRRSRRAPAPGKRVRARGPAETSRPLRPCGPPLSGSYPSATGSLPW